MRLFYLFQGIGTDDIVVQTAVGGWTQGGYPGDFIDAKLADHSLKPIITHVETSGRTISARALCIDSTRRFLYYSDLDSRAVNRIRLADDVGSDADPSARNVLVEFDAFLPDVGAVHGMAIDGEEGENGGYLYFSEAQSGTVSRVELSADGGLPGPPQVLASGLIDPMGIALEPSGAGARVFLALRGGSIRAVARDGSDATVQQTASLAGGSYEVRRFDSGTLLDGIAISESEDTGTDPTELRLYWSEYGRAPGIKRSTLDGTRPERVSVWNDDAENSQELRLIWPRGLAFGAGASAGLLFCENLGKLLLMPDIDSGRAEAIAEVDSYPAAAAVQALVAAADRAGEREKYFTQSVR